MRKTVKRKRKLRRKTRVVNVNTDSYDVFIGRPSKWGNDYPVSKHGRKKCIELYRKFLLDNPKLLSQLEELRGKRLGCFCAPKACHGDVLVELLERLNK